jgi:GNAT superfamily N-acetyltransferase
MTRNNADFHGVKFTHKDHGGFGALIQAVHPNEGVIGHMLIGHTNELRNIMVNPEFQRKGIATGMWKYAKSQGYNPEHSMDRTDEGDAWAKSLGEVTPKRFKDYN